MSSTPPVLARRVDGRIVVVPTPAVLTLTLPNLRTADGHDVTLFVTAKLALVDRPADKQLFCEQFLADRDMISAEELRAYFTVPLTQAAAAFVGRHDAEACQRQQDTLDTLLRQRVDAIAFSGGLELAAPLAVVIDSQTLTRDRRASDARRRQLEEIDHAVHVSAKLTEVGPIHRLPVSEQSALLPALLAAATPTPLWLTAGPNVLVFQPDGTLSLHGAPTGIGPLRCVRDLGNGRRALGGTLGIAIVDERWLSLGTLPGGDGSGRAFNSIVEQDDHLLATHGGLGLVIWSQGQTTPARVIESPEPARLLMRTAGRILLAMGGGVFQWVDDAFRLVHQAAAPVVAVLPFATTTVVIRQDGTLTTLNAQRFEAIQSGRHSGSVYAGAGLALQGLDVLLLADVRGWIDCVTPDGRQLLRLAGKASAVRMVASAGNRIVGVSADRSSLLVFDPTSPAEPHVINVLARTGHTITDLCAPFDPRSQ